MKVICLNQLLSAFASINFIAVSFCSFTFSCLVIFLFSLYLGVFLLSVLNFHMLKISIDFFCFELWLDGFLFPELQEINIISTIKAKQLDNINAIINRPRLSLFELLQISILVFDQVLCILLTTMILFIAQLSYQIALSKYNFNTLYDIRSFWIEILSFSSISNNSCYWINKVFVEPSSIAYRDLCS